MTATIKIAGDQALVMQPGYLLVRRESMVPQDVNAGRPLETLTAGEVVQAPKGTKGVKAGERVAFDHDRAIAVTQPGVPGPLAIVPLEAVLAKVEPRELPKPKPEPAPAPPPPGADPHPAESKAETKLRDEAEAKAQAALADAKAREESAVS